MRRATGTSVVLSAHGPTAIAPLIVGDESARELAALEITAPARPRANEPAERRAAVEDDPSASSERTEQRSRLEREWHAQPHDPARSAEMRSYLQETAAALSLPAKVVKSTDCGSSVCKVQLELANMEQASLFGQAAQNPELRYEVKQTKVPAAMLAMASSPQTAAPHPPAGETEPSDPQAQAALAAAAPAAEPFPVSAPAELPPGLPPIEVEVMLETSTPSAE